MKRLLLIIFVISLGAYLTVQYYKDRRFNPPSTYDYSISEDINRDFYDPTVLENYYETALEVGTYARSLWLNEEIDVRFLDKNDHESFEAVQHYNQLLVTTKRLEDLLVYSKSLEDKGYGNPEIEQIIENDLSPEQLEMIETIAESLPQELTKLKEALANQDADQCKHVLHKIKPSIVYLGNQVLMNMRSELHDAALKGDLNKDQIGSFVRRVEAGLIKFVDLHGG